MVAESHMPAETPERRLVVDVAPLAVHLLVVPREDTYRVDVVPDRLYPGWLIGIGPDRHCLGYFLLTVKDPKELISPVTDNQHLQLIVRRPYTSWSSPHTYFLTAFSL